MADPKVLSCDGLQPIKAYMEQHQTVRLLMEVLLFCTRGLRFRSTTFPLFDLQFKCFTHVRKAFSVIFNHTLEERPESQFPVSVPITAAKNKD